MNDFGNSPAARDIEHVIHSYTNLDTHRRRGPLIIEKGKGVHVIDDEGREYIEGLAGLWCASFGFGEEALIEAATEQMRKLPFYHQFGHKSSMPQIELAEKLTALAPPGLNKVLFANSGSEANDTQVKLQWYVNNALDRPRKKKILARHKAYHGVTVASASLTGLPLNHAKFDLPIANISHADAAYPYRGMTSGETEEDYAERLAQQLEAQILAEDPETVAAFIAEPVCGAGGVMVPPVGYFPKIQAVLKKYDIMMIADEVICGFGRTGNMWGSETFEIHPDSMSCAKQLSSAYMPISAVIIDDRMYEAMLDNARETGTFAHGYTYSAHPVCAAVAVRTLELMEERHILEHVRAVAPVMQGRLRRLNDHPLVGDARGVGLLGGVELVRDKATKEAFDPKQLVGFNCSEFALKHGLITRAMGDILGFCPPLIIQEDEINAMFDRLEKALDDTVHWLKSA